MRVFLVGFMGVGKTTIGRRLAKRLAWPFVDVDREVERSARMSIAQIFRQYGEQEFRRRELLALRATEARPRAVVAVGGGGYVSAESRAAVDELGTAVFLDAPFEMLAERVRRSPKPRPLFADPEQAHRLYESRRSAYESARLRVAIEANDEPDDVVTRIVQELQSPCAI